MQLSEAQLHQYHSEGYLVLPNIIPPDQLTILRQAAQQSVDKVDAAMDAQDTDRIGINLRGVRYFAINPSHAIPDIYQFSFSDLMAALAKQLLASDSVVAFWEQYVIKRSRPQRRCEVAWHQDSAYVPFPRQRYLTCWCALNDMSEANGTARILPFSRGARDLVEHHQDPTTNDRIGYTGDDPGDPVICPAGSIAFFHQPHPALPVGLIRVAIGGGCI